MSYSRSGESDFRVRLQAAAAPPTEVARLFAA